MQFSIHDLLWLTVVAAILVAWWAEHWRQATENEQLRNKRSYPYFTLDVF